ncbi:hypothetical protein [Kitasatospora sp. NPDC056531]|uniref:hypothetical protein n=1 Tax=Kitasatospora sp. NPDC056531 TaxID=3345856 RepID=UPI0036BFE55C
MPPASCSTAGPGRLGPAALRRSRAVWDSAASLKGRTIRLTGFATPKDSSGWQPAD